MSKVILTLLWFCIAALYDWLKYLAPHYNQPEVKAKSIVTYSHAFPALRALRLTLTLSTLIVSLN